MRPTIFAAAVLAAALAAPTVGAAPTAAEKETARTAFERGDVAFDEGNYEAALEGYEAADAIMGAPPTAYAVCETLSKLGRLVEARDACLRGAQRPEAEREPPSYATYRDKSSKLADALAARIASVTFDLGDAGDASLRVTVDGRALPAMKASVPVRLDPGKHELVLAVDGYQPWSTTVRLEEGATEVVPVSLVPAPVAEPGPGSAAVEPAVATDEGISPVAWVGFGIGAAGLVVGAVTGGLALSQRADLDDQCTPNPGGGCDVVDRDAYQSDLDQTTLLAHVSTAGFAVAGAGVILGFVGLFALGGDDDSPSARLTIGPSSIAVNGRF